MNEGHLLALVHQSVGVTPGLAVAAGGQVVSRAPGVCPAPPLWLWAQCSCCFFPWCQGVVSCFLFGCTQGCWLPCVLLCFRCSCVRWVFLVVAGCLGPCSCATVLVLLVRARGPALVLGLCLAGFPAVCAVTPIPTIASLCNNAGSSYSEFCQMGSVMGGWLPTGRARMCAVGVTPLPHSSLLLYSCLSCR